MISACSKCNHQFTWKERNQEIWMKESSLKCPDCRQTYRQSAFSRIMLFILIPLPLILRYVIPAIPPYAFFIWMAILVLLAPFITWFVPMDKKEKRVQ